VNDEAPGRFDGALEKTRPRRRGWRLLRALGWLLLLGILAVAGFLLFLDTQAGHRFIADRIEQQAPSSGLRIRIGRIDGSIWDETRLKDVQLLDPDGLFAHSPEIALDWHPLALWSDRLDIDRLAADLLVVRRAPKLRPSAEPRPILPGFDIRIGDLRIARLQLEPGLVGQRRVAALAGSADIRAGRAMIRLNGQVAGGGDRLAVLIDAEPDRDRFDIDVRLQSPEAASCRPCWEPPADVAADWRRRQLARMGRARPSSICRGGARPI
jgi:translocation and assembly module TamB